MLKYMCVVICALRAAAAQDTPSVSDCLTNALDSSIYCRGSRAINNVLHNLNKSEKPIVLLRGLEIVPSKEQKKTDGNNSQPDELEDNSFIGRFAEYLRTHELNLKFADLLADDESERRVARDWERVSSNLFEARKKDKGQGMVLVVVAMFAKMMAAIGMGGIGMLAMKALGVATAALAVAALVGIKSMGEKGHESSHSVQYIPAEGHHHMRRRRRRSLNNQPFTKPLDYKQWQAISATHHLKY